MKPSWISATALLLALALGGAAAVVADGGHGGHGGRAMAMETGKTHRTQNGARAPLSAADRVQVAAARAATARYRDAGRAVLDGYRLFPGRGCVSGATGLMGYHFVNSENLYDGRDDVTRPDYMMYAPTASGGFELVGVEWEQPYRGQPPPTLFGQQFDGPMAGHVQIQPKHYDLHVWLHHANPDGLFARYNPAMSCCPRGQASAGAAACPDPQAPFLGAGGMLPRSQVARRGGPVRWVLTWTHPDDRREIASIVVHLRAGSAELGQVIVDGHTGALRATGAQIALVGRPTAGAPAAEPGRRMTARLALALPRQLAASRLTADLVVRDVQGRRQQLRGAAAVDVAASAR